MLVVVVVVAVAVAVAVDVAVAVAVVVVEEEVVVHTLNKFTEFLATSDDNGQKRTK